MRRVTAVHNSFWLKGTFENGTIYFGVVKKCWCSRTFRSGEETSGSKGRNGRTRFKNRTVRGRLERPILFECRDLDTYTHSLLPDSGQGGAESY
ncbi:hypothetical protein M404DRAFT_961761 [Pisolithus tinctorius Marx 270]|uniref:Uncharacterized protein n=1 Tax=Pisolithus tinctorius Marx 270 TaxID=870435 RepID=A0A0C3JVY0_PISTI|nr:hypothetical protein M404DRAFT_961761 [Pisolithus tinctorius Marx 270]